MRPLRLSILLALAASVCLAAPQRAAASTGRLLVTTITDESDACLSLLSTLRAHREPTQAEWARLWASDGYKRLKRREAAMGRAFEDSAFAAFLRADSTQARAAAYQKTLDAWKVADMSHAGGEIG